MVALLTLNWALASSMDTYSSNSSQRMRYPETGLLGLKRLDTVRNVVRLSATRAKAFRVAVTFHCEPYWLDVSACRRAYVGRRAAGQLRGVQDVADKAGVARSTVSRFLNGHRAGWSLDTVRVILEVLELRFEEVVTPRTDGR